MPETIPQIRPSFNRSLRLETRPELLSADTGALVQRELMDRSGLIDWLTGRLHDPATPEFDPLSAVGSAADSTPAAGAGLARPVRRRTACVRIRACGWRARPVGARRPWRRATGWRRSRPCPDCWTRSAGRRTFRSCTRR